MATVNAMSEQQEKDTLDEIDVVACSMELLVQKIERMTGTDPRWTAIAKTDLQKGFMELRRAITASARQF